MYGYINRKGTIKIKPQYQEADIFSEGLAPVSNGKKFGFINVKGDTVIDFIWDDVFAGFTNGLSDVTRNDSCGYINKTGVLVIPLIYETCYPFQSRFAQVGDSEGEEFLINRRGKPFEDDGDIPDKKLWKPNKPYLISSEQGFGLLNANGDTVAPPIYQSVGILKEKRSIVKLENKWGVINNNGEFIIKPQFDELWHFNEGLANFRVYNKWGFVNRKGQVVIQPQFDYASQFDNGRAYIELNGKAGWINKKGMIVIQPIYEPYRMTRFE